MPEQFPRWQRSIPVAALVLVTAAGLATATTAGADPLGPSGAAKGGAPAVAPSPDADAGCTLSPSLTTKPERLSCIGVGATLSRLPALGQTATLSVTVKAGRAERATTVTVDLPTTLAFADGTASVPAVTGAGPSSRATLATLDLAKGASRTWTRTVKAVAPGAGEIQAAARSVVGKGRTDSGADFVRLTVGAAGAASRSGTSGSAADHAVVRAAAASARPVVDRPSVPLPAVANAPVSGSTAAAPGTSCVTGSWNFLDAGGVSRGVGKAVVQVYQSGGGILASAYANGTGGYTVCFATGGVTKTVFVRFILTNPVYRVVNNAGSDLSWSTDPVSIADNTTRDFGYLRPANSLDNRPNHAYLDASTMYDWIYQNAPGQNPGTGCWSPYASSCLPLVVHWANDNPAPSFFSPDTREVTLAGDAPDSEDRPVHEYGHALMFGLHGNTFPVTTNCASHSLFVASSTTCGWTEGWGDWVDTSVWGNTLYTFAGGGTADFNTTWGDGQDTGDQVEGRVVQALDSINDGVKYPFDNIAGPGFNKASDYFYVLRTYRPTTFAAFWSGRAAAGQDVSQASLSALYQGTIDYGFRNPLTGGVGKVFPQAVPAHNYSFTTTRSYWSAVAVQPVSGSDVDLTLYNDASLSTALGSSAYGGTTTDFVAINSNSGARALQTYFPRVTQFAGTGGYTIAGVEGFSTFSAGTTSVTTGSTLPITIMDSYQTAGVPVYYRAVPQNGQSVALTFLQPGQTILGRGSAVNSGTGAAGAAVPLSVTPSATGYGGLVLSNQGLASGTVTLYADTTAPTGGTIAVNGGAGVTHALGVTLTLSAADAETGVANMQISTDGTFDTEAVVPYATTATTTLSGQNGNKPVYVRYQNNSGMWSAPVSDRIALQAAPAVTSLSVTSGPVAGGKVITVTGSRLSGTTQVLFGTTPATSYTVVNDSRLTVTVPAGAAGQVHVRAQNGYGLSPVSTADFYRYVAAPAITSLSRTTGPAAGGTTVIITGTGFTGATSVKFGTTAAASYTVLSATRISAVTPAVAAGAVHVRVTAIGGVSPVGAADTYTFR